MSATCSSSRLDAIVERFHEMLRLCRHRSRPLPLSRDAPAGCSDNEAVAHAGGVIPAGLEVEVALLLALPDLAMLAATERGQRLRMWESPGVWRSLAQDRGLHVPFCPTGLLAREAFRHAYFRLGGDLLRKFDRCAHQAILEEGAYMLRGLDPSDRGHPAVALEDLCLRAERALTGHDPECETQAQAAEAFVEALRRRLGIISDEDAERLEHAFYGTRGLHACMVSAMHERMAPCTLQELEASFWEQEAVVAEDEDEGDCWPSCDSGGPSHHRPENNQSGHAAEAHEPMQGGHTDNHTDVSVVEKRGGPLEEWCPDQMEANLAC